METNHRDACWGPLMEAALSRLTMDVLLKMLLVLTDAKRSKLSCSRFY